MINPPEFTIRLRRIAEKSKGSGLMEMEAWVDGIGDEVVVEVFAQSECRVSRWDKRAGIKGWVPGSGIDMIRSRWCTLYALFRCFVSLEQCCKDHAYL